MMRSILNRSFLMAAFCVLALAPSAHAKMGSFQSTKVNAGDVNDDRTAAGFAYKEAKKAGDVCPFANKGPRDVVASIDSELGSTRTTGKTVVH